MKKGETIDLFVIVSIDVMNILCYLACMDSLLHICNISLSCMHGFEVQYSALPEVVFGSSPIRIW